MNASPCYVFYDSGCATCHFVVRTLLRLKARDRFRFLPMEELDRFRGQSRGPIDTIRVVEDGRIFEKSEAVFRILSKLSWPWTILLFLRILPRTWADALYSLYARNRYRIAGRADAGQVCERAPAAARGLLLDRVPDDFWVLPEASTDESNTHDNRPTKGARI